MDSTQKAAQWGQHIGSTWAAQLGQHTSSALGNASTLACPPTALAIAAWPQVTLPGHICAVVVTTLVLEGWSNKLDPTHSVLAQVCGACMHLAAKIVEIAVLCVSVKVQCQPAAFAAAVPRLVYCTFSLLCL